MENILKQCKVFFERPDIGLELANKVCLLNSIGRYYERNNINDAFDVYYSFTEVLDVFDTDYRSNISALLNFFDRVPSAERYRVYSRSLFVFAFGIALYPQSYELREKIGSVLPTSKDFLRQWCKLTLFLDQNALLANNGLNELLIMANMIYDEQAIYIDAIIKVFGLEVTYTFGYEINCNEKIQTKTDAFDKYIAARKSEGHYSSKDNPIATSIAAKCNQINKLHNRNAESMISFKNTLRLAIQIHKTYIEHRRDNSQVVIWDDLALEFKLSNVAQAKSYGDKLQTINCFYHDAIPNGMEITEFSPAQIETLASEEHKRWMEEKKNTKWSYGAAKSVSDRNARRVHASIAPYAFLPESEKEKDRDAVRFIIKNLNSIGLHVYAR